MAVKKMKIGRILISVLLLVLLSGCLSVHEEEAAAVEQKKESETQIYFFHNTVCGSCDGTEEFVQIVDEQIS